MKIINELKKTKIDWEGLLLVFMLTILVCGFIYTPESFANFDVPITKKLIQVQKSLITIGKSITGVSVVVLLILFIIGRPQWKWAGYATLGGALLMAAGKIARWMVTS